MSEETCPFCKKAVADCLCSSPAPVDVIPVPSAEEFWGTFLKLTGEAKQTCQKCLKKFVPMEDGGVFDPDDGFLCFDCSKPEPKKEV